MGKLIVKKVRKRGKRKQKAQNKIVVIHPEKSVTISKIIKLYFKNQQYIAYI